MNKTNLGKVILVFVILMMSVILIGEIVAVPPSNSTAGACTEDNPLNRMNHLVNDEIIDNKSSITTVTGITSSNFPNPFNPETTIKFSLPFVTNVSLEVFNIRGQKVKTVLDGSREFGIGSHSVVWDGTDSAGRTVGSGVYFYRISAGEMSTTKKMLLMK